MAYSTRIEVSRESSKILNKNYDSGKILLDKFKKNLKTDITNFTN